MNETPRHDISSEDRDPRVLDEILPGVTPPENHARPKVELHHLPAREPDVPRLKVRRIRHKARQP